MSNNANTPSPVSAENLAQALGGKKSGQGWMARCPAHDDHDPSLSINEKDGKPLVYCHAGCSQKEVIDALRQCGLWSTNNNNLHRTSPKVRTPPKQRQKKGNSAYALEIWNSASPAEGSKAADYLTSRGITIPIPPSIRFLSSHKHQPSGGEFPCMVAQITEGINGSPSGVHRTFLAQDGEGKAPVDPAKMMLGPAQGGVVRLGEPRDDEVLMVGEGLETTLSAMQATGLPAWAALSTSGMKTLELPAGNFRVIILADGDEMGENAARATAKRWVEKANRKVSIARPPFGKDFNDVLRDYMSNSDGDKATSNHPISEIINAAEEIRDLIDELAEEVENGTLTPEKLFSSEVIDRLAQRREEDDGQAFYERFRIRIQKAHICRVTELDKAVNKRSKEIEAKQETPAMFGNYEFEDRESMSALGSNGEAEIRFDRDALGGRWKNDPIMGGKEQRDATIQAAPGGWETKLQKKENKRTGAITILNSIYNLQRNLRHHPAIEGTFRLNEKTCRVEITRSIPGSKIKGTYPRQLTDEDITAVQTWLSECRYSFSHNSVAQQIENVAKENVYNPLVDWIESLNWDGTQRLHEVMPKGWNTDDNAYTREVGELLVKGIVTRIIHPGCEFRLVPILIGRQWIGKSASLKALVGDRWVTDQFVKPSNKDSLQLLRDYLIVELGEMDVLRRAEAEELKQFISSRYDDMRDPYARKPKRHPRSCILVGTSNDSAKGLLNDPGENSRFLPIQIRGEVDFDFIKANKDQWFAEAWAWLQNQTIEQTFFKLSKEAMVIADETRDEYRTEEPLEEAILAFAFSRPEGFTNEECAQYLVDEKKASHVHNLKIQIGKVMIKQGYKRRKVTDANNPRWRRLKYFPSDRDAGDLPKETTKPKKTAKLKLCNECKNFAPNGKLNGSCKIQNDLNVPRFTQQQGGCKRYEAKTGIS